MKINHYVATLDARALAPMSIADTLLRLAEEPALESLACHASQIVAQSNSPNLFQ
jgi:hypothetical protein